MSEYKATAEDFAKMLLGFPEDKTKFTSQEIEDAFKKAALRFHPDAGGSDVLFRALSYTKEIVTGLLTTTTTRSTQRYTSYTYYDSEEVVKQRFTKDVHIFANQFLDRHAKRLRKIVISYLDFKICIKYDPNGERKILVNWRWADIAGITVWDRFFSMVPICAAEYQEKRYTLAAAKKYLQTAGKKSALCDGSPIVTIKYTYRPFRYFF